MMLGREAKLRIVLSAGAIVLVLMGQVFTLPTEMVDGGPTTQVQAVGAAENSNVSGTLEAKIRAAWTAFKNKNRQAYGEFLADDFLAIYADGEGTRDKARVLRDVEGSVVNDVILSRFKVTPLGPDSAFVTYEAFIKFPSKAGVPFEKVYVGEVWVKRGGQWKTLHYQETRVK